MADKKNLAGRGMSGTPRGYVKKKDIERVDREMTPILEGASAVLSALPAGRAIGAAGRAAKSAHKALKSMGTYEALGAAGAGAGIAGAIEYAGHVVDSNRKGQAKKAYDKSRLGAKPSEK